MLLELQNSYTYLTLQQRTKVITEQSTIQLIKKAILLNI